MNQVKVTEQEVRAAMAQPVSGEQFPTPMQDISVDWIHRGEHNRLLTEARAEARREGIEKGKQERTEEILQYCDEMNKPAAAAHIRAKFLPQPTPEETLKIKIAGRSLL